MKLNQIGLAVWGNKKTHPQDTAGDRPGMFPDGRYCQNTDDMSEGTWPTL